VKGHQLRECQGYGKVFLESIKELPVRILSLLVSIDGKSSFLDSVEISVNCPERDLKFVSQFHTIDSPLPRFD
jgi:hypothetical protein